MNNGIRSILLVFLFFWVLVSCTAKISSSDNQNNISPSPQIDNLQVATNENSYKPIKVNNIDKLSLIRHIDQSHWAGNLERTQTDDFFVASENAIYKYSSNQKNQVLETLYDNSYIRDVDFANDSTFAVIATDYNLYILDLSHKKIIDNLNILLENEGDLFSSRKVAISKDNSKIAVSVIVNDSYLLYIVDLKSKKPTVLDSYPKEYIYDMDWNPKKDMLAVCSDDGDLDIYSGDPLVKIESNKYPEMCNVKWSNGGEKLAITSYGDDTVSIYDTTTSEFSNLYFSPLNIDKVKWSNDDKLIGTLWANGGISHLQIYDLINQSVITTRVFDEETDNSFLDFAWSKDNDNELILSSASEYNGLVSYDYIKDEMKRIANFPSVPGFMSDFYLSDDSKELFTISTNNGYIFQSWSILGNELNYVIYPEQYNNISGFDVKNNLLAYLRDENGKYVVSTYDIKGKTRKSGPILETGDLYWFEKDQFLTCCIDRWDSGEIVVSSSIPSPVFNWDRFKFIQVSPNNQFIALIYQNQNKSYNLGVYDFATLEQVFSIEGLANEFAYVSWNPDSNSLLTSSDDGTIRIWDLAGNQTNISENFQLPMFAPVWNPDGNLIASISQEGELYILKSPTMEVIKSIPYAGSNFDDFNRDMPVIKWTPDGKFLYLLDAHSFLYIFGIK